MVNSIYVYIGLTYIALSFFDILSWIAGRSGALGAEYLATNCRLSRTKQARLNCPYRRLLPGIVRPYRKVHFLWNKCSIYLFGERSLKDNTILLKL